MSSIWIKNGKIVIDGSGHWEVCDNCPCTPPVCPTACCLCCGKYIVSWPATTTVICNTQFGFWFEYTYNLAAGSQEVTYSESTDCLWYWNDTGFSLPYTYTIWNGTTCNDGTMIGSGSGTAGKNVRIECVDGKWYASVLVAANIIVIGDKTASPCPGGSYSNGMSVANGSPCNSNCCPDCTLCAADYTVVIPAGSRTDCFPDGSGGSFNITYSWGSLTSVVSGGTACYWLGGEYIANFVTGVWTHWTGLNCTGTNDYSGTDYYSGLNTFAQCQPAVTGGGQEWYAGFYIGGSLPGQGSPVIGSGVMTIVGNSCPPGSYSNGVSVS